MALVPVYPTVPIYNKYTYKTNKRKQKSENKDTYAGEFYVNLTPA